MALVEKQLQVRDQPSNSLILSLYFPILGDLYQSPHRFHSQYLEFELVSCSLCCANRYSLGSTKSTPSPGRILTGARKKLHTIRSVFIISPERNIRVILQYPMETGRSIKEILRVIDSLQAHEEGDHIKTGADWEPASILFDISLSES